jgi:hypothetical protein
VEKPGKQSKTSLLKQILTLHGINKVDFPCWLEDHLKFGQNDAKKECKKIGEQRSLDVGSVPCLDGGKHLKLR